MESNAACNITATPTTPTTPTTSTTTTPIPIPIPSNSDNGASDSDDNEDGIVVSTENKGYGNKFSLPLDLLVIPAAGIGRP